MPHMKSTHVVPAFVALLVVGSLAGCGLTRRAKVEDSILAPMTAPVVERTVLPPLGTGQSAAVLDQTTAAQKAAATAKAEGVERSLGLAIVTLGSPAEQGFWIRSPLIAAAAKGRVQLASGASVNVDLRPGTGAALLSLAAYRALGLDLTALPEVTIYVQ